MATGHTAIVTGANHGIGAATAQALAQRGCAVLCTFLRVDDPDDPGTPQEYRDHRAQDAAAVVGRIRDGGGKAAAQPAVDVKSLHAKIGELTLENDFLEGALGKAGLLSAKR